MSEAASEMADAGRAATARKPHPEVVGLLLLALALLFNAILLAPEARIERVPVNDLPFHFEAAQRLGQSIARGEPLLDPWVSQWSLGYPLWRVYQPLPHLLAAAVMSLGRPFAAPAASFAGLYCVLLVLLPASVYLGARLLGLNPLAAGLSSLLILALSEAGDFSRCRRAVRAQRPRKTTRCCITPGPRGWTSSDARRLAARSDRLRPARPADPARLCRPAALENPSRPWHRSDP